MKTEKSCGAVVFTKEYDDFKYVIIRSKGGTYGFPKGHVEKVETEKETALREIMEETGLKVEFLDKFKAEDSYKFTRNGVLIEKTVVYFLAECNSLTFKTNEEEIESISLMSFREALKAFKFKNTRSVLIKAHKFLNERLIK